MKKRYIINEKVQEVAKKKGCVTYPDDFPHLKETGTDFHAWIIPGDDAWHIETTLNDESLLQRLAELPIDEGEDTAPIRFIQVSLEDGLTANDIQSLLYGMDKTWLNAGGLMYPITVTVNNTLAFGFVQAELLNNADGPSVETFEKAIEQRIDDPAGNDGNGLFFVGNYPCCLSFSEKGA